MFHFLRGQLAHTQAPIVVLDVQGVGYELQVPISTFDALPALNQTVILFTHVVVREDAEQIFGFMTARERDFFRSLIKVNGIGPKAALSLLSHLPFEQLINALSEDHHLLTKVPGIGKKTAERLVIEFRDKLGEFMMMLPNSERKAGTSAKAEAFSALLALGYKEAEAQTALKKIEGDHSAQQYIRNALGLLAK